MKTIFKKGMKVYDQLLFPDVEGVVTSTNFIPEKSFFDKEEDYEEDYEHPYPIEVDFKGQQALYKNDGSGFMDFPTLSTKPYKVELVDFEQKAPAPTYREVWEKCKESFYPNENLDNRNYGVYPSLELANAAEALRELLFLREYYNECWKPDYNDNNKKFIIYVTNNEFEKDFSIAESNILTFKSEVIRDKFLEEQRELLEIAKPLL